MVTSVFENMTSVGGNLQIDCKIIVVEALVTSFGEGVCQEVVYTQQAGLKLSSNKQKAPLGRKRKPEVFTALGDDVVTRLSIIIT